MSSTPVYCRLISKCCPALFIWLLCCTNICLVRVTRFLFISDCICVFSVNNHACRMTGELKEMPGRELNTAEEQEKRRKVTAPRDKDKPAQKNTTLKRGQEHVCGLREHQKVHQMNSFDRYRPECKNTWEEFQISWCGCLPELGLHQTLQHWFIQDENDKSVICWKCTRRQVIQD